MPREAAWPKVCKQFSTNNSAGQNGIVLQQVDVRWVDLLMSNEPLPPPKAKVGEFLGSLVVQKWWAFSVHLTWKSYLTFHLLYTAMWALLFFFSGCPWLKDSSSVEVKRFSMPTSFGNLIRRCRRRVYYEAAAKMWKKKKNSRLSPIKQDVQCQTFFPGLYLAALLCSTLSSPFVITVK